MTIEKLNHDGHGSESPRQDKGVLDVTVVLVQGDYASTAIGPIEVFQSTGVLWNVLHGDEPQPRFRVQVASIDGDSVVSPSSLEFAPKLSIRDIAHTDIIIIPASGLDIPSCVARSAALLPWLREWYARGAYIAGVCTGVALIAEAGLLDGRQATTHWAVANQLRQRYPNVLWRPELFVTEDRRLLCSGGVYASIDLSLYLVEKFCSHETALQCAKALLVSMPRSRQSGYSVLPLSRPHADEKIRTAEEYLQKHYNLDVSIKVLADKVGMGPRNFIRRFKAATGYLPGAYSQMLRVAAAKELLESGAPSIQNVCTRIGYGDVGYFRSLFKRHTGMTPAEYRSQFAHMSMERGDLPRGQEEEEQYARRAS
ncbi:MAG TPA: helix-turn-helix domain-containing protein [Alphaproteobacteria bacterium]|nr:helix-turn-helix domain-containing protein [Alphaproteobacteria bacterium]